MTKIKTSSIITQAKTIKTYVEKNKKLPSSYIIDDNKYTNYDMVYLLSKYMINLKATTIESIKISKPTNNNHDIVDISVYSDDYIDMGKRTVNYCLKNKEVPSFITTKKAKKRINWQLYLFCISKIIVYYSINKKLPNFCAFNSANLKLKKTATKPTKPKEEPNIFISKPHLTTYNAGLGQDTPYYCACNSLQQSFYKLTRKVVPESTIAAWAGTTSQGTGHPGINTAVAAFNKKYGYNLKIEWKNFSDLGTTDTQRFKKLGELMKQNNIAVFCHIGYHNGGDNLSGKTFGHYECLDKVNLNTSYVRALNSLGSKCNGQKYCGFLQDRKFNIQKGFIQEISQKSICIITK